MNKNIKARNGVLIPKLGFGVYKIPKGQAFEQSNGEAIRGQQSSATWRRKKRSNKPAES
ncbi:hypothetical protein [Paenibacillus tianjinensis]|uniref:Aldo/keto reductase n=1 Tax=Paenibacillus tianjinensis TaxID=2810347 RepID=A0ABX7LDJ3_9BACL|nr:hypothetical protein [Paenibacillus tianjinensis]QSF46197.1 hypothetical protein JRJ22_06210 [Paenibacillus tianjinensis]